MKILLIKPGMGSIIEGYNINDGRMEPLSLALLAAMVPQGDEIKLYDDRMEALPFDEKADLVGITVDSFTARRAYAIAAEFRLRGVKVVLGGMHVSLLPQEAQTHADSIVIGDAEGLWDKLIEDARHGRLKPRYESSFGAPQAGVLPRRDIFKGKGYLPVSLVQYSRGCTFNCAYCSVARFFKSSHQCRPVEDVLREIERDNLKYILFVDDNMVADRQRAKELFRRLIPLKIRWATQASINMVDDQEMLELMERSGCIGHLIGFESINLNTLKWLRKGANLRDFDMYDRALGILRKHGFLVWASFILGNDFDTVDTIQETVDFAIRSKFTLSFFHILQPYPGTDIYDQFKREGRLLYGGEWWNHPEFRYNGATFVPKLMEPNELGRAIVKANKDFYSASSISRRLLDRQTHLQSFTNLFAYLRLNQVLRSTST